MPVDDPVDEAVLGGLVGVEEAVSLHVLVDALLRLAESFRAIRYRDDYVETCGRLRQAYSGDVEVARVCRDAPVVDTTAPVRPIPGG